MFITASEMKNVLYEYQMNEIAEEDTSIIEQGIAAAITEVRSYFAAANARRESASLTKQQYAAWKLYDVDAIFSATGNNRDPFVMRMCQRVAAWNICELSNVDVIYEHLRERYDNTIKTLEKIAGIGDYANARIILHNLPSPQPDSSEPAGSGKPFRMVSRTKFQHE